MLSNLSSLLRYRGLIQSLVARELKARYRGSVLGFVWSFVNPLLLLSIYSFVFTRIMQNNDPRTKPFSVFMFCGLLPWMSIFATFFDLVFINSLSSKLLSTRPFTKPWSWRRRGTVH